ncbi:hypothetical protein [Streptosporangium sp. V21-05]|uniref:hypothetical protein n=1 Tax=Streptosporangium sp. V21-05 TaxID=3446115 RepID=UPI003F53C84C
MLGLERMGETSTDNLIAAIERAKAQPLSRVFCVLGVRGTGRSMSRRIARHFGGMDAVRAADAEAIEGIGPEKSPVVVAELADLIDKLVAAGVTMTEPGWIPPVAAPATGTETSGGSELPLARMSVVVTGSFPVKFFCSPSCLGARSQRQRCPAPRGIPETLAAEKDRSSFGVSRSVGGFNSARGHRPVTSEAEGDGSAQAMDTLTVSGL